MVSIYIRAHLSVRSLINTLLLEPTEHSLPLAWSVQLTLPLVKVQLFSEEIFSGTCCDISLLFVVNFFLIEIRKVFFVSPSLYLLIYSLTYLLTYLIHGA